MQCYFCDSLLQQTSSIAVSEKMDELTVSYACPQCGKTYQMQFVAVAIFAYTSGREEPILLLRQCKRCHQLYREGARHECQE